MPRKQALANQQGEVQTVDLEIRGFSHSLPMLLMRAREAVMQRFRPHLRARELTEQQWRILRVLAEFDECDMFALSERCAIQPPSLSRTVPLLISRGLLVRHSGRQDQRRVVVGLTTQGWSLFREMSAESVEIYAQIEADIGSTHIQELYGRLGGLIEHLGAAELSPDDD